MRRELSSFVNYLSLIIIIHVCFQRQLLGDSTCRWICVYRAGEVMKHEASAAIRNDCGTTWRIYTNTYQYVPMADMKTNLPMTDTWKYHPCQLSTHLSTQCSPGAENISPKKWSPQEGNHWTILIWDSLNMTL